MMNLAYSKHNHQRTDKHQRGFALVQVLIAIMILLLLSVFSAQKYASFVKDTSAESTGRYLISVRSAVIAVMSKYNADLTLENDNAPSDASSPTPEWVVFTGDKKTLSVKDLKKASFLPDSFPDTPPTGRSVHIQILRKNCPGDQCRVDAYVFTCWPISDIKPQGTVNNEICPAPPAGSKFDANMVGAVIASTEGYGATNYFIPALVRGPLFNIPLADLGLPVSSAGIVAVEASINNSLFSQFVRQGDTRHIYLKDNLTVSKHVSAEKGIILPTNSIIGQVCPSEGAYGTSTRGSFVVCASGRWFELNNHILLSSEYMADGQPILPPTCPSPNMQPFAYISMQNSDVTLSSKDISITGNLGGSIEGNGFVNSSGAVHVSGNFSGTSISGEGSYIRVAQGASIVSSRVVITPASSNARALVVQGCRYL
ncbi:hypothetical protein [Pseudomonas helleri]|uniref:hypothetical protein n=1 Tax=Pseudomonas helleri TaxID=1608996 RepID=UPI003FD471F2